MSENLLLKLLKHETERDKQIKMGPSTAGSLCDLCIVDGFVGIRAPMGKYWLGGRIGTALHDYLEKQAATFMADYTLREKKVVVAEIEGWGTLKGTADLTILPNDDSWFPTDVAVLIDWKSSSRTKLNFIRQAFLTAPSEHDSKPLMQARFTTQGYINQTLLYAKGMRDAGVQVEKIQLSFVARDGLVDEDTFNVEFDYNEQRVTDLLVRLQYIWDNHGRSDWKGHPYCYGHAGEMR